MQTTVVEVSTLATSIPKVQTTGTILMVRPVDFTFNEQTAVDNEFQHQLPKNAIEVNNAAMEEFENSVNLLRSEGVKVLVVEKPQGQEDKTPDAVFPNNWISTEPDGTLVIYPMATPNRRAETKRLPDVQALLLKNGLKVNNHVLIGTMNEDEKFLEGTGSMVIDHLTKTVYGAISVRTNVEQLNNFAKTRNYSKVVSFRTKSSTGKEFYHTNVMMSIGTEFAVVCFDCIETEEERQAVKAELEQHGKRHIIPISLEQAEKFFCGNILEVKGKEGHPLVVMSKTALNGFTEQQRQELAKFGKLIALPIDTIEYVGGGSARCMMCEVFNPKK